MSLLVVVLVAAAAGNRVGRWWVIGFPLAFGGMWALLLNATGHGLADSPLPFVVAVSTVAVASGVALGRRGERTAS